MLRRSFSALSGVSASSARARGFTKVAFVAPEQTRHAPVVVELVTEEQAATLKQIWPKAVANDFTGKDGQSLLYYSTPTDETHPIPERFLWVGVGKAEKLSLKSARKAVSTAVEKVNALKLKSATISLDTVPFLDKNIPRGEQLVQTVVNSALQSNYFFDRHLTKPKEERSVSKAEELYITVKSPNGSVAESEAQTMGAIVDYATILANATNYARDLANLRADECNPEFMEKEARKLAAQYPDLFEIEVLNMDDLRRLGLNLLVAVGKGAEVPPRLIVLRYIGAGKGEKNPIGLVGKGITFDSGGLNMKPTNFIEEMYMDMSGSAAVLSTMATLPKLGLKQNVVGVLALAENAVSDKAVHPSSIIKSYKGLTVEIGNTDAEGRLVLADAFTYVQKHYKIEKMVDLATLTGACVVALGEHAAGLFTNDDALRDELRKAGDDTFERLWPMPLYDEYSEEMKGSQSDLKNNGKSRYGGASTAAAFLKEFVEKDVKWVHLDIAGPAMTSEKRGPVPKGGTGFGVQLLLRWLSGQSK